MSREITSTKNPLIQRFRAAAAGGAEGVVLAEGRRLVAEALAAGCEITDLAIAPRFDDPALRARLEAATANVFECSDSVLARLSQLETPPGLAALVRVPAWRDEDLLRGDLAPLVVVAAGVRDPGNLGSLVRAAEAAGAGGLLTMKGAADPFRDKAVRGSMGSVFRLPVRHGLDPTGVIAFARDHRLRLVVADGGHAGDPPHTAVDLRKPTALVLGAEAAGVPEALLRAADARTRIPLRPPVESLNVAVAAGVLLFEARRQRE
ncbi:MAG: RNA methyltransferase [Planctomycetes bacterium]|nr:RNA methyltransferase [Planctomycetota bacterium]